MWPTQRVGDRLYPLLEADAGRADDRLRADDEIIGHRFLGLEFAAGELAAWLVDDRCTGTAHWAPPTERHGGHRVQRTSDEVIDHTTALLYCTLLLRAARNGGMRPTQDGGVPCAWS